MMNQSIRSFPTCTLVFTWTTPSAGRPMFKVCGRDYTFYADSKCMGVDQRIMILFYQAVLESIVRYGMSAWYGNLSIQLKSKLACLIRTAMKVMGRNEHQSLQSIYEQSVLRQAQRVVSDPCHILHTEYERLPSGGQYRLPQCILNCFKN